MKIKEYYQKLKSIFGLSFQLAKANFKLKNEGSYLGILWYLLSPLCFFSIMLLIGGAIKQNNIPHYQLYVFLGLIMFNFFQNSTGAATRLISSNGGIIKSSNVSSESFVISGILQVIFSHIFELIIFLVFMFFFGGTPLNLIFYIPIFFFFILFVSGISFMLATIGVYINDLSNIWDILGKLLWFATPIFYAVTNVNDLFRRISYLNPMFHFINISREIIIYNRIPALSTLLLMAFSSIVSLLVGLYIFNRYKYKFAELV